MGEFDPTGYIATGVVMFLVGLALQYFEGRPRLICFSPGLITFDIHPTTGAPFVLRTDVITVQNVGRRTARGVQIVHQFPPAQAQLVPGTSFTESTNPSGHHIIEIASLGANEWITLQTLNYNAAPPILAVRSDDGPAKMIPITLSRVYPKWFQRMAIFFMLLGVGLALYWLAVLGIATMRVFGTVS